MPRFRDILRSVTRVPPRVVLLVLGAFVAAQLAAAPPTVRRAKRPEFPSEVRDAFYSDAREKLQGERPEPRTSSAAVKPAIAARPDAESRREGWSQIISRDVLEDEIKARLPSLVAAVENPTRFKSGEYQTARRELAVLAAMLAIVAQYDGRVRWQDEAGSLHDQLVRASVNCKVASDAALADARARAEDLQLLVRGGAVAPGPRASGADATQLAERAQLMQRLEMAQQQLIAPAVADARTFAEQTDTLLHESEVVAALAKRITNSGYEFADDEGYLDYAKSMQQQASALGKAVRDGDYERARKSAAALGQSCTNCHEGYRG